MLCGRPLVNRCYLCCCNAKFVDHLLFFLSDSSFFVDVYASVVWDGMGHARFSCGLIILLVSLAWEA